MYWALVVLTLQNAPVETGLVYRTLADCYAAEDQMAAQYVQYVNERVAKGADRQAQDLLRSRMLRGLCVPHAATP